MCKMHIKPSAHINLTVGIKGDIKMKVLFIRKWSLIIICASILAVLTVAVFEPASSPVTAVAGKKPIYSVDTTKKQVAISFDAAWGADKTEAIMDILDSKGARATFFLVGFWV